MGLILLTLVCAVGVAWLLGGRLSALEQLPLRGWPLLAGMVGGLWIGTGAALAGLPTAVHWLALTAAAGCALAYCARNRTVHGTGLVGAGLLLNALVVMVNDGMPVSAVAAARAGTGYTEALADPRHVPSDADTALGYLGDVIPVPLPLRPEVISLGDMLVAAGLAQLLATAMLRGSEPPAPGPVLPQPARPRRRKRPRSLEPVPEPELELGEGIVRVFRPETPG
jgi:hypothetical protein